MAFAAARMIKEKKNLEAEHKKRSSDGLSKTKSKVILPHVLTHQNHIRHPQGHITSYLDTSWHTTSYKSNHSKMGFSIISWQSQWFHIISMQWYHIKEKLRNCIVFKIKHIISPTKDTGFTITSFIWLQTTREMVLILQTQYSRYPQADKLNVISEFNICRAGSFHISCFFAHRPLWCVPVNSDPIRLKAFKLITVFSRKVSILKAFRVDHVETLGSVFFNR